MKIFSTLLLAIIAHFSVAQISFFKEINTQEEGSSPANFTEVNGITFFSVKTIDGYNLWKTDGTEAGTVAVSNKLIIISSVNQPWAAHSFQVFNNELHYFVQNSANTRQLWKTNGDTETLVLDNFFPTTLYWLNNRIHYLDSRGLFKIDNGESILINNFSGGNILRQPAPMSLNNQLIFFTSSQNSSSYYLQVWKSDGTEVGTGIVKSIEDMHYNMSDGYYDFDKRSLAIDNQGYFIIRRLLNNRSNYTTELWKTNGVETTLVKNILDESYNTFKKGSNLADFNGKLIFIFDNSQLWLSDGTNAGTNILKTFSINYDLYNKKWGILNNKFYFSASTTTDYELWQSDGTSAGTTLFKDLNPSGNANPNYFITINNKLFFKANNDELWQSDGTETGTTFVLNIPKPVNSADLYRVTPEFVYTSNNQLYFSNYDATNDFELWKSDGTIQNTGLLKNITTRSKGSNASDKKIKVGNIWYFSAIDHRGTELWKSDGTPEGTTIVKDITAGGFSTFIREIVAVGNVVYFTANTTNDNKLHLFKSDGTESGTVEVILSNGFTYGSTIDKLTAALDKLYFMASHNSTGYVPWVSDGTSNGTHPIANSYIYNSSPSNLISLGNKLLFTSNGLWVSDGTQANTYEIFGEDIFGVPQNPICLVEFNNKIYFFSFYQSSPNYTFKYALFESDGTRTGTKVVKEFSESDKLTNTYLLFLEKSADRLYFRAGYSSIFGSQYFNLWTSDGTEAGTYKLKTIPFTGSFSFKFTSVGNQFYMFLTKQIFGGGVDLWTSNGTIEGTNQVFQYPTSSIGTSSISFNNKLYFNLFDNNHGFELWTTNGSNNGTYLVEEVRPNMANSYVSNIMNFNEKLLFWATDDTHGSELWQYLPANCEGNRNYTILSGSWNSSSTWSCGRIPTPDDIVIIKSEHTITILNNYQTTIKGISTENGAVLKIPQSAVFTVNPR